MALQAQWSLDATTTSVASFSQDLVRAMTTDNVQPLALLACERFGATLAISPDTCRRIERSVLPPCETRAVKFLKSVAVLGTRGGPRNEHGLLQRRNGYIFDDEGYCHRLIINPATRSST
ncbi:unnamed protein product [Parascedosporium putredinis]|uniref:Uncharacterized protein n=1 Tax=Parascedosporium putredinis TaxID=1442378 RepID=A0A9P1M8L4_9PEZI|nr:unnamed protein product [Parascedosporium putredinis]CAI7993769.1 unnamed protein product [Parascedosporium putredinis]